MLISNRVIHFYFGAYSAFIRFIDICAHECPSCRARLSEEQDTLLPTTATIKAVGKGPHYSLLGDNVDEAATPRTSEENV
jgi:hypothetical protein